jgi:hypothetical protein
MGYKKGDTVICRNVPGIILIMRAFFISSASHPMQRLKRKEDLSHLTIEKGSTASPNAVPPSFV